MFISSLSESDLSLFRSALQGVHFLHSHGWVHRDLKPQNIGYSGSQAVLLDLGGAMRLDPGELVPSTPGRGGTVPYLAPECEMQDYEDRVDVWAMAIIWCELIFGSHPWMAFKNPWRAGNERLRRQFHELYDQHVKKIHSDSRAKQGKLVFGWYFSSEYHVYLGREMLQRHDIVVSSDHHSWRAFGQDASAPVGERE
jgi:serine/threonine protein kinase